MRIYVAGIGPGSPQDITPAVLNAVKDSDVIVGYKYYFQFIREYIREDAVCVDTGRKGSAPKWHSNTPRAERRYA